MQEQLVKLLDDIADSQGLTGDDIKKAHASLTRIGFLSEGVIAGEGSSLSLTGEPLEKEKSAGVTIHKQKMTIRELMDLVSDLLIDGAKEDEPIQAILDSGEIIGFGCGSRAIFMAGGLTDAHLRTLREQFSIESES